MTALARISGPVLNLERKSGTFDGRDWGFTEATVLVANQQTVPVRLDDNMVGVSVGDFIDFLISVVPGRGDAVKIRAIKEFPASLPV